MPKVEIKMPEKEAKIFLEDAQKQKEVEGLTISIEDSKEIKIEKKKDKIEIKGEFSEVILTKEEIKKIKELI